MKYFCKFTFAIVSFFFGALLGWSAFAQSSADPTFNGLVKKLHCSISSLALCSDGFCPVIPAAGMNPANNVWISLTEKVIGPQNPIKGPGFVITEVSPAAVNASLYVKFTYQDGGEKPTNGLIILTPIPSGSYGGSGGYKVNFGLTGYPSKKSDGALPVDMTIRGGNCEIMNID